MDVQILKQNKRTNTIQSLQLIGGMCLIMGAIGWAVFGWLGAFLAIAGSLLVALFGPRVSPIVVLKMFKARLIHPNQAPELYQIQQALSERAELDHVPAIYYIPSRMMNAFATGTGKQAVVAVSDGLLRAFTPRELAGVLAHEISHIRHRDIRIMSIGDSFSRFASIASRIGLVMFFAAMLIGQWSGFWRLLFLFFAPSATVLLQLALSRSREFNADMGAAELTRDPQGLVLALEKLERQHSGGWIRKVLFPGAKQPAPTALRTHPPTPERIERLMSLVPQYAEEPNVVQMDEKVACCPSEFQAVKRKPTWHVISGFWH